MDNYRYVCCDECGKTIGYVDKSCNDGYAFLIICKNCHDKEQKE